jgi:hypothetical protein
MLVVNICSGDVIANQGGDTRIEPKKPERVEKGTTDSAECKRSVVKTIGAWAGEKVAGWICWLLNRRG